MGGLTVHGENFGHEELTVFRDPASGVAGAIAIDSTVLGPAMGGLRLARYAGLDEAIVDALRLAHAMSAKSAAAGLDLGGGKAVILDDGEWGDEDLRAERLRAVGEAIEALDGRYITAEDVGTTPADMDRIGEVTRHVAGRSAADGGSGDPSRSTARTVFAAIEAAVRIHLGRDSLAGCRVGVQGVGHVGATLVGMLSAAGAEVAVTDADPERCRGVARRHGAAARPADGFLRGGFEVLAPCALGGVIGPGEADRLGATIVAGAANNQLTDPAVAALLAGRGILFVPDFIANAGGIIQVGGEALGLAAERVEELLAAAAARTAEVLLRARSDGRLPLEIAAELVRERLRAGHEVLV